MTNCHYTATHRHPSSSIASSSGSARGGGGASIGTDGLTDAQRREMKIKVVHETFEAAGHGGYNLAGVFIRILLGSIVRLFMGSKIPKLGLHPTRVTVENMDCLDAAQEAVVYANFIKKS